MMAKWYSGTLGGLKLPDIWIITGEEKPRKTFTQETWPDRESKPGPLRDRRACYHLSHSGGPQTAVLLGMDRCGSFPLLSSPHSLVSIWTGLKRSENIPGTTRWRWGEWISLTGSSGLHRNSPQGLKISSIGVFDRIRDSEIPLYKWDHWRFPHVDRRFTFSTITDLYPVSGT